MTKLTPRSVTIGSEAKNFALDDGVSNGSSISITFDIPRDADRHELAISILSEKEKLDLFVLSAEYLKGALSSDEYARRKALIKANYDRCLHRQSSDDSPLET